MGVGARDGVDDPAAARGDRRVVRLVAHALHARSGPLARGPGGLRPAVREGPDLPRQLHHQLVPALPHGALERRGRRRGDGRQAVPPALPLGGRTARGRRVAQTAGRPRLPDRRDDAARDDARRHRGRRAP